MGFSFLPPRSNDHWFRVGTVDVTTTVIVTALTVLSLLVYAADPGLLDHLILDPHAVASGRVWRLATWPLPNAPDLFTALRIFLFYYFGTRVEHELGRRRFVWFLGILTVVPALISTVFALATSSFFGVGGITGLEFGVLVAFVAINPSVQSFYGIPLWVAVAVIIGLDVLQYTGSRAWAYLLFLLLTVATGLIEARSFGVSRVTWIPKVPLPAFISGDHSVKAAKKRTKATHLRVVQAADTDSLLDKIAEHGIDSLTRDERRRLDERSQRRDN